jgi:hypothetical protein
VFARPRQPRHTGKTGEPKRRCLATPHDTALSPPRWPDHLPDLGTTSAGRYAPDHDFNKHARRANLIIRIPKSPSDLAFPVRTTIPRSAAKTRPSAARSGPCQLQRRSWAAGALPLPLLPTSHHYHAIGSPPGAPRAGPSSSTTTTRASSTASTFTQPSTTTGATTTPHARPSITLSHRDTTPPAQPVRPLPTPRPPSLDLLPRDPRLAITSLVRDTTRGAKTPLARTTKPRPPRYHRLIRAGPRGTTFPVAMARPRGTTRSPTPAVRKTFLLDTTRGRLHVFAPRDQDLTKQNDR